ncbi:MAG: cysteine hydrolase [Dehalococcoidia bacterium]|nr:cysteine hydrolase [Dehalococcoidia bacterium]
MARAVMVADMLRCFLEKGYPLYCGDRARAIIPRVRALLEREVAAGSKVFFICDAHAPDDLEFRMFPPHCVAGSEDAELIPELRHIPGEKIYKTRYSGFFRTPLEERLAALRPERIIVCGVCTDICVCYTTADARARDYEVEVPTDCVATFNEKQHQPALEHMERVLGARLVVSERI